MKKKPDQRKRIITGILILILSLTAVCLPAFGQDSFAASETAGQSTYHTPEQIWPEEPETVGEAVILMEANTDAVIYQKNPDQQMYPASTTKILTAIVVLENCSLDETVTFTEECCDLEDGAVTIDSVPGEQMSLKDVMYGLLLPSGNDCAMALALHVAGSVSAFVDMMNEKAREIGALASNFSNPSGLYNSKHYTTASDLAKIAQYAFRNSTFVDIISHPTYIIEPTNKNPESRVLVNTHEMITPGNPDYNSDVIGGKTGYLYESGRCLVTYAERDGITLLAVILDGSYYGIFSETQNLLDFGWDHFTIVNVSESERRFSFADEKARVQIDPSNEILTLNNVPFEDLTAKVNYAYYLDEDEYAKAKADAGITPGDPRQLYGWIEYSYAGYYLGSCNIFINPDMALPKPSFIHVIYINIWIVILVAIAIIAGVILLIRIAKKAPKSSAFSARSHRRRSRVRYYSKSDSIDLQNQYIRSGKRNRGSVHSLEDIGVQRIQRDEDVESPAGSSAVRMRTSGTSQSAVRMRTSGTSQTGMQSRTAESQQSAVRTRTGGTSQSGMRSRAAESQQSVVRTRTSGTSQSGMRSRTAETGTGRSSQSVRSRNSSAASQAARKQRLQESAGDKSIYDQKLFNQ